MIKNYFKIAWRNIIKSRFYSGVNIIGLSTGIAFTMLIGAYVWSQLQVNKHLKNINRQYIIESNWKDPNEGFQLATLGPLAKALKENYPNLIANYYRFDGVSSTISKGDKSFRENLQIGDSTLLNMFGFTLLHGDAGTALKNPFTVVITKNMALKYFGRADAVGQTITIASFSGSKHDFLVTGVLNTLSKNSVTELIDKYPGDFYVSTENLNFFGRNMDWKNPFIVNYIELQKGVSPKDLEKPIASLEKQNASSQVIADLTPKLVPLNRLYLTANNGLVQKMIYALSAIALFILIMALINFINMSVSRSSSRMREIGIRKVMGGIKRQLIMQFLTESVIIVFLATLVGFVLYVASRNLFTGVLGNGIPSLNTFPFYFLAIPVLFIVLFGFVAGIYPAFVLSSLKTVESLKRKLSSVKDNALFRNSLIAFQFVTATVAFVGAIIISKQINLFLSKDLGYNKDYVLSAQVPRDWSKQGVTKMENIRDQLEKMLEVGNVSLSYEVPDGNNSGSAQLYQFGSDSTQAITTQALTTDEKYLSVYQIPLKAGSFFEGHSLDSGKIVLNESAVHALGYKDATDAIGQQIRIPGDPTILTVKGVTGDFHFGSMQQKIAPISFFNVQFGIIFRYLSIKIKPGNVSSSVNAIQKQWQALMPGAPFEYKFMDDTLASLYQTEIQIKKASYIATILAMIIVLLGVVGLISLNIQKRTKEIGIRKVLGSSVAGIMSLFIKEFLTVIVIGGMIACPLAYIVMRNWLQGYAYRIDITVQPFVISIVLLGLITTLLICLQTMKTAMANPVKSLRAE
jgi:ABC-type antimicrobial peptide transport system permease subunit